MSDKKEIKLDAEIKLPDWDEIYKKHREEDQLNPIELFIYNNEPAGIQDANDFREQLKRLIKYCTNKQA